MKPSAPRTGGETVLWVFVAIFLTLLLPCARPALASEALGDLEVQLRLVEVTPSKAARAHAIAGDARIEVVLQAALPLQGIRVRILRPDGTPWIAGSHPLDPGQPEWSRVGGGEPLEPGDGSPSLGARGALRTVLTIPLDGAAVHEIIVEAVGEGSSGLIRTENMIRVALGVPLPLPDDDGTVASYPMEVRP